MTEPTAAVEVWARMLCAADVHVNDGDHPTWQQLAAMPGRVQDDYRKAAQWLLPRLSVGQTAAPSAPGELEQLRTENARMRHELEVMYGGAFDKAPPSVPADRGDPGMYYCDDCDHAFTAPTDTESCICSCGARAWQEKPADADLRTLIRRACAEADGFRFEGLEPHDYQKHADAILALFPPSAYRSLLARLEADRAGHLRAAAQTKEAAADEVLVAVSSTFASAFRHAAAMAVRAFEGPDAAQAYMQRTEGGEQVVGDVEAGLGHLADSPAPSEIYRHYKGGLYTVLAVAEDTGTGAPVVVYHDEQQHHWTRPLAEFAGDVADGVRRFTLEGEPAALPAPADRAAKALAGVRRLCEMTIEGSVRVDAIHQARDTLAAIDRRMADAAGQAAGCSSSPESISQEFKDAAGTLNSSADDQVDCVLDERVDAAKEQPDVCPDCEIERCDLCHACPCSRGEDWTCDGPSCPARRIRHSGPDTKFCVLCQSGEHVRVTETNEAEPEVFGPDVVAYCHPTKPRAYLCRQHGDGTPGLTPVESDDLPDGGGCDVCGVDVLIPQRQAGEGR